jgi:hypothetical protein
MRHFHVGRLDTCGGNMFGEARCGESAQCTNDCNLCGFKTHWTCCGCTDLTSLNCRAGITKDQALKNVSACSEASPEIRLVMHIPNVNYPDSDGEYTGYYCIVVPLIT